MMKKFLLFLPLFFLSVTMQAQQDTYWRIYPKVGFNLSKFPNDKFYAGDLEIAHLTSRYKQAFTGGVELSVERGKLSAITGLMYSNRGTKYNDYTYEDAYIQEKVSGVQYSLHYLELPLMGGFEIFDGLKLKAGVQFGYLLNAQYMMSSITSEKKKDGQLVVKETDIIDMSVTDSFKKFDFSIPVGVSYEFSNVLLDARYVIGLTNNSKSSATNARHSGFIFTVGYGFDL